MQVANGETLTSLGSGDHFITPNISVTGLYTPSAPENLLSISQIISQSGKSVLFTEAKAFLIDQSKLSTVPKLIIGVRNGDLWSTDISNIERKAYSITTFADTWENLHKKLNHPNIQKLKDYAERFNIKPSGDINNLKDCLTCIMGKMSRGTFHTTAHYATYPGEILFADVCIINRQSRFGFSKFLLIIDDFTKYSTCFLLKDSDPKNSFSSYLIQYMEKCKNNFQRYPKWIRTDNAFRTNLLADFCNANGITQQFTTISTSQQNGTVERFNRTVCDGMRSALVQSNLPHDIWCEAILYSVESINQRMSSVNSIPYEQFTGKQSDIKYLHRFGELVYVRALSPLSKISPKSTPYIFVGYSVDQKGYRLLESTHSDKIIIRSPQDCKFITNYTRISETPIPMLLDFTWNSHDDTIVDEDLGYATENEYNDDITDDNDDDLDTTENENISDDDSNDIDPIHNVPENIIAPRDITSDLSHQNIIGDLNSGRTTRHRANHISHSPRIDSDERLIHDLVFSLKINDCNAPDTYQEAHSRVDSDAWKIAEDTELNFLKDYGVYDVVPLPEKAHAVDCRYVYTYKNGKENARLCAKGFSQREGIDWTVKWSPVARFDNLRGILPVVATHDYEIEHVDVSRAFLNAPLDCPVYMKSPPGMTLPHNHVLILKRALYGLKQASRLWYNMVSESIISLGYIPLKSDPSMFVKGKIGDSDFSLIVLYVDDFLLIGAKDPITKLKQSLFKKYKMKDLGPVKIYCGLEFIRNRTKKSITIHQNNYTKDILHWMTQMIPDSSIPPSKVPFHTKNRLFPYAKVSTPENATRYQIALGNINHLAINTRPDIAYATSLLSQFSNNPAPEHWDAMIRVYGYLSLTTNYGITYKDPGSNVLVGYADANHGGYITDKINIPPHSITGNLFVSGGGAIQWVSKRQKKTVAGSFDAEYISLRSAAIETEFIKYFYKELGINIGTTTIYEDNESVISTSLEPKHSVTKAVNIDYHIIKEHIEAKTISLAFLPSSKQPADSFTKALSGPKIQEFNGLMGVGNVDFV